MSIVNDVSDNKNFNEWRDRMIDLNRYGLEESYLLGLNQIEVEGCVPARVIEMHRDIYKVISEFGESYAKLKGSMYKTIEVSNDLPAVGDFILIRYNPQGESVITKVLIRKSKFSRTDYSGHSAGYVKTIMEQVVAANFDYVFIIVSLNYDFNIRRIQRYLTAAWQSGGTPIIVLTKADLVEDYSKQIKEVKEHAIGVEVIAVSSYTGMGMEQLQGYMKPSKTLVFLGSSGVGKSTLVNALAGKEIMQVNSIREDDSKGRHTTTHRQLIMLESGVMIIDTPGMRELGMWDIREGLGETFSDIQELFLHCKFSNCSHKSEPGCAIIKAMNEGVLEPSRWEDYNQLKREAKFTEDKAGYLKEKKEFSKKINKYMKHHSKTNRR